MPGAIVREQVVMIAICTLIALGALGVAAWTLLTGQIHGQGVDGLFLLLVCLSLAAAFSLPLLRVFPVARLRQWIEARRKPQAAPAEERLPQESSKPG